MTTALPHPPVSGATLPDLSIRQLEYLVAVDDAPTWSAAAARVGVSASALSQGLSELERRIGVPLFDAVGRRRVLRPAARPVLDHARQVVALTSDLVAWADRVNGGRTGRLRVGMIDVAAVVHFPQVLRTFRADRPDVDLTLTVGPSRSLLDAVADGRLDVAIAVEGDEPTVGVTVTELMTEPLVVYGPPDTDVGRPATWGPWVLFPPESHTRRRVQAALVERGAPIEVVAESNQPDVLREMVLLGLGWTVLPRSQGDDEGLSVGDVLLERDLVVARRSGSVRDPVVDDLVARLVPGGPATGDVDRLGR